VQATNDACLMVGGFHWQSLGEGCRSPAAYRETLSFGFTTAKGPL
jgi:hypothetical protein